VEVAGGFANGTFGPTLPVGRQAMAGFLRRFDALPPIVGGTEVVSVTPGGVPGAGVSDDPAVSSDGRFVAFTSAAPDLVPDDANDAVDVFVRDRENGITERVSVADDGSESASPSSDPDISADGRFVVFSTPAVLSVDDPEDAGDAAAWDVYLRDRVEQQTLLVHRGVGRPVVSPAISDDGGTVAYHVTCGQEREDVFIWDRTTDATTSLLGACWVDTVEARDGMGYETFEAAPPELSGDGRYVVTRVRHVRAIPFDDYFWSEEGLYRWDLATSPPTRVEIVGGPDAPTAFVASSSGRYVVWARNGWVAQEDVRTGEVIKIPAQAPQQPATSANGRYVAFVEQGEVRLWDREDRTIRTISSTESGAPPSSMARVASRDPVDAGGPSLSADGGVVAWPTVPGGSEWSEVLAWHWEPA